jgi:hypothetical protein
MTYYLSGLDGIRNDSYVSEHVSMTKGRAMRISSRNIRAKLESGDRIFGTIVQTPSPEVVEIVGYTGFDFVWLDAEHGTMNLGDIATQSCRSPVRLSTPAAPRY